MTLVEIMVSFGLLGVLALASASFFAEFTTKNKTLSDETELNEQIALFQDRLQTELENATQILGCGCGSPSCEFSDIDPDSPTSRNCALNSIDCDPTLLSWETETAFSPTQLPSVNRVNCLNSSVSDPGFRGCKQLRTLKITPPTDLTPGALTLFDADGSQLSKITGVTHVFCGRPPIEQNRQHLNAFRVRIRAKVRSKSLALTDPNFESWRPGGLRFEQGVHRELITEVPFRNLNQAGIHFGRSAVNRTCIENGSLSASGDPCCSGFSNGTECISEENCLKAGQSSALSDRCCSHQISGGTCS